MTTDAVTPGVAPVRGTRIDRFTVTAPVSGGKHGLVLQARDDANEVVALKVAMTRVGAELVDQEKRVLETLDGDTDPAPRLIASGRAGDQPYCALSWLRGVEARVAAADGPGGHPGSGVLAICRRVARAYAALHARGVLHGQVHPRHVLVDGDGTVGLVDFSVAASGPHVPPPVRLEARFNSLSAPEQAESLLNERELALTAAAEQYSVAALLYLLLTGRMYARLGRERLDLARTISSSPTLRFAERGAEPWPALEEVLARALHKHPGERYQSVAALGDALDEVASEARTSMRPQAPVVPDSLTEVLATFRRDASSADAAGLGAPTCSINFGAAGIAFALTRLSKVTGNAADLEQAERWLAIADERCADPDAFDDGDELTPETVGVVSPFHCASGVPAVRAFLSEATGDHGRQQTALDEFRAMTQAPCANPDVTLGRSAVLLVSALLYAASNRAWPATQRLGSYGDRLSEEILRDVTDMAIPYYGIAHGWAGIAYTTLMWARARGAEPHGQARAVLDTLATIAEPFERGCRWPLTPPDGEAGDDYWPGWCHGNAGYVFLWNLAWEVYKEDAFADLAERAAWLIDTPAGVSSLCCGSAGQAYAALNQYRASGDERWRAWAMRIAAAGTGADALAGDATNPLSLYKSHAGLALLAVELQQPERAAMPLFEFET